jgi:S-adenosylmethionine synthetase
MRFACEAHNSVAARSSARTWRTSRRAGAYETRRIALEVVKGGASECKVMASYAPNLDEPIDVSFEIEGCGLPPASARERLTHEAMWREWLPDLGAAELAGWVPGGRGLRGII